MVIETLWGVFLGFVCFWIASQGSTVRGIVAASLAVLLATICSLVVAFYFASLSVVRKAVTDAALGQTILNTLFDRVLGIAEKSNEDPTVPPESPTHIMSPDEVEQKLNDAANKLLSNEPPSTKWAGPFFWLAKQIQRVSVWATVKVIVASCSQDEGAVNMLELRDRLGCTVDDGVVSFLKQYFKRLAFSLISIVSLIAVLLAFAIQHLPI